MNLNKIKYKYLTFLLAFCCFSFSQSFFTNVSESLGVQVQVGNTALGNGISFADFNNDGWDDISVCTAANDRPKFYMNIDGVFFAEVDLNLGLEAFQNKQINWVDYDNDGDKDLFLTSNTNGNRLFNNMGNLIFQDVTVTSGLLVSDIDSNGASWADVNNDGCLDVYISNHTGIDNGMPNLLYQSNCDGTFTEVSEAIGLSNRPAPTFCAGFFDFNNDGWQDLYVANDRFSPNLLYQNNGDGTYTDVSETSNTGVIMDAMTVTVDDYNNDGFFDMYITNTPEHVSTPFIGNALFKNESDETFTNISETVGTLFHGFAWGASFFDMENDGDLDLYVSSSYDGTYMDYPSYALYENIGNNSFYQNTQLGFENDDHISYGNAIGDINNDGLLDIVVLNNNNEPPCIWENKNPTQGNYLKVDLIGVSSNRDGIGAKLEISVNGQKQFRHVMCGEGYMSQHSFTEQFGVGNAQIIDYLKITWPSGIEDMLTDVNSNQRITVLEGSYLSTEDFETNKIEIYPTLIEHSFSVEVPSNGYQINIYNQLGQLVRLLELNTTKSNINISDLNSGLYYLEFHAFDTDPILLKIIKH